MNELGFEQDSVFTWVQDTENGEYKLESFNSDFHGAVHNYWACGRDDKEHPMFSAYTVAELGEIGKMGKIGITAYSEMTKHWWVTGGEWIVEKQKYSHLEEGEKWADVLAKMLIYLKEQELI